VYSFPSMPTGCNQSGLPCHLHARDIYSLWQCCTLTAASTCSHSLQTGRCRTRALAKIQLKGIEHGSETKPAGHARHRAFGDKFPPNTHDRPFRAIAEARQLEAAKETARIRYSFSVDQRRSSLHFDKKHCRNRL